MVATKELVAALSPYQSYHDYGTFRPSAGGWVHRLGSPRTASEIRAMYQNRPTCSPGLHEAGWMVEVPKASMYIWSQDSDAYLAMGSLDSPKLLAEAKVAGVAEVRLRRIRRRSPVRFALIENEERTRQAGSWHQGYVPQDGLL